LTKEEVWFKGREDEMSQHKGKVIAIVHALYGLKSSSAHWREYMAQTLCNAGFVSCKADPDLRMQAAVAEAGWYGVL
jgi:hypothetical protein